VVGNASSEEGSGADEEGNDSVGAEGSESGIGGSGAASVDGAGSLEGSVGSVQAGKATSSTDSCACAIRRLAKKIAATSADVLAAINWAISAVVAAAARVEKRAKRRLYRA
jgi:hypothetical protein